MSRIVATASANALVAANVPMVIFVELQLSSGTIRLCSAPYSMTWNGQLWVGFGRLGSIEPIKETTTLEVTGLKMSLSGVDSAVLSTAFNEHVQGRTALLYLALLDASYAVLPDPIQEFRGRIDIMQIDDTGADGTISLTVENRIADFKRPNVRRFNSADQQALFPGDRFFDFVPDMQEKSIVWPNKDFFKQ